MQWKKEGEHQVFRPIYKHINEPETLVEGTHGCETSLRGKNWKHLHVDIMHLPIKTECLCAEII